MNSNEYYDENNNDNVIETITVTDQTQTPIQQEQEQQLHPLTIYQLENYNNEQLFSLLSHRSKCILEVYTTEKSYLHHLNHVISFYLNGIRNSIPPILDNNGIYELFSNIESIRDLSLEYVRDMENQFRQCSEDVATPFILKENKLQDLYIVYASNHSTLISEGGFNKLIEKKQQLVQFLQRVKDDPDNTSRLDLQAFLIMPVQRMIRYAMLFNEVDKHTKEEEHGTDIKQTYQQAKQMGTLITRTINEKIRTHQNKTKVVEIQSLLVNGPKLVGDSRMFVREGGLMKVCRKHDKFRWFFMFTDSIVYCTTNIDSGEGFVQVVPVTTTQFTFRRMIMLCDIHMIKDVKDRDNQKNAFQIISTTEKSFTVYAETLKIKNNWLDDFKVLLEPGKVQESTGITSLDTNLNDDEVPVWIPDKDAVKCMFCNCGFNLINRRHHCRSCGKVVCSNCSPNKRYIPNLKKQKPSRVCLFCYDYIGLNESSSIQAPTSRNSNRNSISITSSPPLNHFDKLNVLFGFGNNGNDRKRSNSFSSFTVNDSELSDNNKQLNSSEGSQLNNNDSSFSTFRKLKNIISRDSDSLSITNSGTITNTNNNSVGGSTLTGSNESTSTNRNSYRHSVNGIPGLSMLAVNNSVVLKHVPVNSNNSSNQPKPISPELSTSRLSRTQSVYIQSSTANKNILSYKPPANIQNITPLPPLQQQPRGRSLPQPPSQPLPQPPPVSPHRSLPIPSQPLPQIPLPQIPQIPLTHKNKPLPTPIPRPQLQHQTSLDSIRYTQPIEQNVVTNPTINHFKLPPTRPRSTTLSPTITTPTPSPNLTIPTIQVTTNQFETLEIKTPPTRLVGSSIPQKPAAPFRKRAVTTSYQVSPVLINQQQLPNEQLSPPIAKRRPLPQTPT